ncbi:MAG: hypothetical protein GY711_20855 [bacterium]|nr:hypothetical protein [bacterium]
MNPFAQTATLLSVLALAVPASAQFVIANSDTNNLGYDDCELTPDGRYAVLRENTWQTSARVFDLASGVEVLNEPGAGGGPSGVCQDGVAVTDERGVVIGSQVVFLDLTATPPVRLAAQDAGVFPRDVAITPDGTIAAVRGGNGVNGGLLLYELATGNRLANAPGDPFPSGLINMTFDVDSVAVTNDHAVFTSYIGPTISPRTRVTVFELRPSGGGPPAIVFETGAATDQIGEPHDVTLTPDGQHAVVRSGLSVGLYQLNGSQTTRPWHKRLFNDPGPFGLSAMDSIEATNDVIATISRRSVGGFAAQLDVFEINGTQRSMVLTGDPHDLAFTPSGERLVARTHIETFLFDVVNLPASMFMTPLDREVFDGTHTSYGAGMDSVMVTDTRAVTLSRLNGITRIRVWDISNDTLEVALETTMPDIPLDLAITPDESRCVVSGLTYVMVIDLRANAVTAQHDPSPATGSFPWCDGVVVNDERAVAFGVAVANGFGWVSILDLFAEPTTYCTSGTNSTGVAAEIFASGSARAPSNDLVLWARNLPGLEFGVFVFGDGTAQTPFGDGTFCVGGNTTRMPFLSTSAEGIATQVVDFQGPPREGGTIVPGQTWYFQLVYRDAASTGSGFNATEGLAIDIN